MEGAEKGAKKVRKRNTYTTTQLQTKSVVEAENRDELRMCSLGSMCQRLDERLVVEHAEIGPEPNNGSHCSTLRVLRGPLAKCNEVQHLPVYIKGAFGPVYFSGSEIL